MNEHIRKTIQGIHPQDALSISMVADLCGNLTASMLQSLRHLAAGQQPVRVVEGEPYYLGIQWLSWINQGFRISFLPDRPLTPKQLSLLFPQLKGKLLALSEIPIQPCQLQQFLAAIDAWRIEQHTKKGRPFSKGRVPSSHPASRWGNRRSRSFRVVEA